MGALDKALERQVASQTLKGSTSSPTQSKQASAVVQSQQPDEEYESAGHEEDDLLEPTPLAVLDNVYEENGDDELMDLGVQMGKMRISERIGGWVRPKVAEELNDTLVEVTGGQQTLSASPPTNDLRNLQPSAAPKLQTSTKSYIGPGPDYIAPASSVFFPGTNTSSSIFGHLPRRHAADQLIAHYLTAVHPICGIVHRPTFETQYTMFWSQIATGNKPVPPVQAIVFAAMFSATVSMTNEQTMQRIGTTKDALVDSLRSGTEVALARANFLRTTKLDTMQAFVMFLIPMIRAEVSRAHSALVGTAIRLAECMGLHRDGSLYNMGPIEVHVRRLVWHQLCFLDMRTCEATGPRPQIRVEDYDTKTPRNINDVDLLDPSTSKDDRTSWTDATFIRIRSDCTQMKRQIWFDLLLIDKKKKSLTSVLVKVQKFISAVRDKYERMIDQSVPIQALAQLILEMSLSSLHIQVLHRYLFSTHQPMPDRLRQVLLEAGLTAMESAIAYETNPNLQHWSWYRGAISQYHVALLLLVEVYAYPMRKQAAQIWKCLDYIFEIPAHLVPKQKAELVLTDLRDRMAVYQQMRKPKVSNQVEERTNAVNRMRSQTAGGAVALMVDASGQMQQTPAVAASVNSSPPMAQPLDFQSDNGRQESVSGGGNTSMAVGGALEDIDWAAWDEVFPQEINGDLNIPEFDMADFTGDFGSSAAFDPAVFGISGGATLSNLGGQPTDAPFGFQEQDLVDVQFPPTFQFPTISQVQQTRQGQPWRDYAEQNQQGSSR